jgi:hypothetical protein
MACRAMACRIGVLGGRVGKCDFMRGRLFSWVRFTRSWVKGSEEAIIWRGCGLLAGWLSLISWSGCEIVNEG